MLPKLSRTLYIGVDPGKKGAIAYLYVNMVTRRVLSFNSVFTPVVTQTHKWARAKTKSGKARVSKTTVYDVRAMAKLLRSLKKLAKATDRIVFCIERQWPRPGDGKSRIQAMAEGYATWTTIARLMGLPLLEISPTSWKPCYVPPGAEKAQSLLVCKKLYPSLKLPRAKESDRAEALLLADYARRKDCGLPFFRSNKRQSVVVDGSAEPVRRRKKHNYPHQSVCVRKFR